jgi:hypothetical protein
MSLDLRDEDGDRLVLSDFNEDVPISARQPSAKTEALLRVHQYTAEVGELPETGADPEAGMSVLLDRRAAQAVIEWLTDFFELNPAKEATQDAS